MNFMCYVILLIFQFVLVINADLAFSEDSEFLPVNSTLGYSSCLLSSGDVGQCRNIFECPFVLSTFSVIKPVRCGYFGEIPIVCCPNAKNEPLVRIRRLEAGERIRVPKEFLFFKCGLSLKYLKVHALGNSHEHKSERSRLRYRRNVVGGEEADIGEFPWITLLGKQDEKTSKVMWICDGVLVHPQWILTAAHCLLDFSSYKIRLGEHNISSVSEQSEKDFDVIKTYFHPDFKLDVAYHDLALAKLSQPADVTENVMPVCLPWKPLPRLVGKRVTLAGWGAETFGGALSNVLRDVDLRIFESPFCERSYSTLRNYNVLWPLGIKSDFLLCAGGKNGGIDACQGDSGGPLVYIRKQHAELIGIVSKGFGCGLKEFPGMYTSVRTYLLWICEMILQDLADKY